MMKIEKEKKHFNRQYIPIIVGVIALIGLIGLLIFFLTTDKDIKFGLNDKTTTETAEKFEHDEIEVDTSKNTCKKEEIEKIKEEAKKIDIKYEKKEFDAGPAIGDDGVELNYNNIEAYIYVNVSNIGENLKFIAKSKFGQDDVKFSSKDAKDGKYSFKNEYSFYQNEFTIEVYYDNDCIKTPIRKFKIVSPVINIYHNYDVCRKDANLLKTEYCDEIIYRKPYTSAEINAAAKNAGDASLKETIENRYTEPSKNNESNNKNNIYLIIVSIIIVLIIVIVLLILIRKKKIKASTKNSINSLMLIICLFLMLLNIVNVQNIKAETPALDDSDDVWEETIDLSKHLCIEAGFSEPSAGTKLVCSRYTGIGAKKLAYYLENGDDKRISKMASRWTSIDAGITSIEAFNVENGIIGGEDHTGCIEGIWLLHLDGRWNGLDNYEKNFPQCFKDDYIRGNMGITDSMIEEAFVLKDTAEEKYDGIDMGDGLGNGESVPTGNEFTVSGAGSGTSRIVTFTYNGIGTIEKAEVSCDGCTAGKPSISGNVVTVTVTTPKADDCTADDACKKTTGFNTSSFTVTLNAKITGGDSSGVALCHIGGGAMKSQKFIRSLEGETNVRAVYQGHDSCETCSVTAGQITPNLTGSPMDNCCTRNGSQASYQQTELNDLFGYNGCLQVKSHDASTKDGASVMLDTYANGQLSTDAKEYCKVYCSQKASIEMPGAITSHSGRYFKLLDTTKGGTTSAYVDSTKTCRVVIDYDKWVNKYYHLVEEEVKNYNIHQDASAAYQVYTMKDSVEDNNNQNLNYQSGLGTRVSVGCEYKETVYYKSDGAKCGYENGVAKSCSITTTKTTGPFDRDISIVSGTIYQFKGANRSYYTVRINPLKHNYSKKTFTDILVDEDKTNNSGCANEANYSPNIISGSYVTDSRKSANGQYEVSHSAIKVITPAKYKELHDAYQNAIDEASRACTNSHSGAYVTSKTGFNNSLGVEDVPAIRTSLKGLISSSESSYNSAAESIPPLEDALTECDTYMGSAASTKLPDAYNVNTDMKFRYAQIYQDEDGDCVTDIQEIGFNARNGNSANKVCDIKFVGTSNREDSGLYGGGNEHMKTISSITYDPKNDNRRNNTGHEYDANKMFAIDGTYEAECYKSEGNNTTYNKTPTGHVILPNYESLSTTSTNLTFHEREYHIEVSAMSGTYDTFWQMISVGEGGVFDSAIGDGSTCGSITANGNTISAKISQNGCHLSERTNNVQGSNLACTLTINSQLVQTGKCNDICPYNKPTKEREGINAFNFKIVEPSNMFPDCKDKESCKYAENWLKTDAGAKVQKKIEETGASDETYAPINKTYSFRLTSKALNEIRNYNEAVGTYDDFDLECDCKNNKYVGQLGSTNTTVYSGCTSCKSKFIASFYNGGKLSASSGTYEFTTSGTNEQLNTLRSKLFSGQVNK